MNNFEVTLLISPDSSTDNVKTIEDSFNKLITDKGGSVVGKEDWKLRDLAYSINNYQKAFYKFYQINIEGSSIQIIKKNLTLNEKIIRHLFIKVNNHEELPTKIVKYED